MGYTASVYCTASVLTLAAIALDRYCSIMDCLRYGARCTLWRSCSVVLWIWLQALLTSLPPLLGWSSVEYVAPMYRYSLVVRARGKCGTVYPGPQCGGGPSKSLKGKCQMT